jgi:hypothetical protein
VRKFRIYWHDTPPAPPYNNLRNGGPGAEQQGTATNKPPGMVHLEKEVVWRNMFLKLL